MPKSELFEIHGSKFEPHPRSDSGQAAVVGIAHTMLFFGIGKNPLNGFFAHGVNFFTALGFTQLLSQVKVFLPNVSGKQALAFLVGSAGRPARTA